MASRYYNPRLAQKVGAAEAGQYMSIAPAVAGGVAAFERQQAKQLKQQELRFEKRKVEAQAFKKALEDRDNILYEVQKNLAKSKKRIDIAPPAAKNRAIALSDIAKQNYKQLQDAIKQGRITRGAALMWEDENVNKYIQDADNLLDKYPEIIANYSASPPSMINSSKDINISNKIAKQEFEFDENNNAIIRSEDGKKIIATIPFDELSNPTYIPVDTEAFTTAFNTVNTAADKAASKGKSLESMQKDVKAALSGLNFTPEQALSIAFDYLGKEQPEYINIEDFKDENGEINISKFKRTIDEDGDGTFGEPEDLNLWVKNKLAEAASNAYEGYKEDYADKFEPPSPTVSEEKEIKIKENISFANNQLKNIKLPKNSKGMIDVDSTVFNRLLNNLNLSVDKAGSYNANDNKIISVKSNITNKTLNFSSDMTESEFNRAVLLLSGSTPEEAMGMYPDYEAPANKSEVINIGSLPIKK